MDIEFLKGQLVAYELASQIVGNESSKCDQIRDKLTQEIVRVLRKTGDFSKYLVEVIPDQIWTVVFELEHSGDDELELSEHDLDIIVATLSRDLSDENRKIVKGKRDELIATSNKSIQGMILDLHDIIWDMR